MMLHRDLINTIDEYPFIEFAEEKHTGPFYIATVNIELWDGDYELTRAAAEITYWLTKRKPIFHAQLGDFRHDQHIFFFADKTDFKEFGPFMDSLEELEGEDLLGEFEQPDDGAARTVHILTHDFPFDITRDTIAKWIWYRDNCDGRIWRRGQNMLMFESESDLIAFKLKFVGAKKGRKK